MLWIGIVIVLILNLLCIGTMVVFERKSPQSVLSWSLVMTFLPLVGFFLYMLLGNTLSIKTTRMIARKKIKSKQFRDIITSQKLGIDNGELELGEIEDKYKQLIRQNLHLSNCALSQNNKVDVFTSGEEKFSALLQDVKNAKKSINILYYIFATDEVGKQLLDLLIEKAKEGVEVNLLIDAVGSLRSSRRQFKKLEKAGGRVAEFFPPLFGFRLFNLKLNYRNHRKIVVIDNEIAYTGGVNIRADHLSRDKKLKPWIDMHLRIVGDVVLDLQKLFLSDWRFAYNKKDFDDSNLHRFFEAPKNNGNISAQLVYSGPDDDEQQIKRTMIKMILSAKQSVVLETPYFVPDESFVEALKVANASGVDVKIITPKMPDKKVVFYTSLSYLRDMVNSEIKVYQREGFLHSKCLLIDNEICLIGTCNADIRSFKLNFEDDIIVYNEEFANKISKIIEDDLQNSIEIDKIWFKNLPRNIKIAKSFYRLFSAIL